MLISLTMTNFKSVESATMDFTEGLNAIRGENEASKSTRLHAIAYALWGSRALPLSLDETVTWGKPASSLKVSLKFTIGDEYTITRSKSGAELVGPGVVVSGQAEVTAFVERITGASLAVGVATLMANQSSLQQSLDSSAVSLIEKLSNMALIDTLVGRIQKDLPSGNTKALEQQLATAQQIVKPVADFSAVVAEIQHASISIEKAEVTCHAAQSKLSELKSAAQSADILIKLQAAQDVRISTLEKQLKEAVASTKVEPVKPWNRLPRLIVAEMQEETAKAVVRKAHTKFLSLQGYTVSAGTPAENAEQAKLLGQKVAELVAAMQENLVKQAQVKAAGIYDESCALCGKMLTDVPEVVEVNAKVQVQLEQLQLKRAALFDEHTVTTEKFKYFTSICETAKTIKLKFADLHDYVSVDTSTTPATYTWSAGFIDTASDVAPDLNAELRDSERAYKLYEQVSARFNADRDAIVKLSADLSEAKALPKEDVEAHKSAIAQYAEQFLQVSDMEKEVSALKHAKAMLDATLLHETEMYTAQCQAYEAAIASLEPLKTLLADYHMSNGLIKKLREVRPVVARELWNLVLHGVSSVFSQIRGVQSTVTRGDNGFLIDGKPSAAFSGSTQDSLGLAIRVTLQKTFLPNIDFILFDEPASGCSETRETEMLGAIVRAGFKQVLLVTHSELADTFASNVIRI